VLESLARLRADAIGFYPPYAGATAAVARYLDVPPDRVTLVNGLDEGIMAAAVAYLRADAGGPVLEAIVPEPAFEIFRFDTAVAGGTLVQVMPHPDFSFPLAEVLAAITPNTRVVFLTNPNNPTGVGMPLEAIRRSRGAAGRAVVSSTRPCAGRRRQLHPRARGLPNVVVGRTFSEGVRARRRWLPGRRAGNHGSRPVRGAGYSVNVAAAVAIVAALGDLDHLRGLRQVHESKTALRACDRPGLTYVPSQSNFVLVRAAYRRLAAPLARGIYLRDRSTEPGCQLAPHRHRGSSTQRAIAAIEEVLCGAR
jgi:histidinol-phosphate aminotransferase